MAVSSECFERLGEHNLDGEWMYEDLDASAFADAGTVSRTIYSAVQRVLNARLTAKTATRDCPTAAP